MGAIASTAELARPKKYWRNVGAHTGLGTTPSVPSGETALVCNELKRSKLIIGLQSHLAAAATIGSDLLSGCTSYALAAAAQLQQRAPTSRI